MRLKFITTASLILGLALLLAWPLVVGPRPVNPNKKELARYGIRAIAYFGVTASTFVCTAVFAWLVLRQTRREYVDQAKTNLQSLIEGALQDHERKS